MDLRQKLGNLARNRNLALFKWTAGGSRMAGKLIRLSDLRLNVLSVDGDRITLSISAPVVVYEHGRQKVKFLDRGVVTVTEGERKGLNLMVSHVRDNEKFVACSLCASRRIDSANQPSWVAKRVLSMGCSPLVPVTKLVVPNIYRLTRDPNKLRLVLTRGLVEALGKKMTDPLEEIRAAFISAGHWFGEWTDEGFLVPEQYVASGGMGVVLPTGITAKSGSLVHCVPLNLLQEDLARLGYEINTGDGNELAGEVDGDGGGQGDVPVDGHNGAEAGGGPADAGRTGRPGGED